MNLDDLRRAADEIEADPTVARGTFRIRYSDGTVEEKSLEVRG